jgi:glycosyltransferase involved in cell wall biosynthesis
MRSNLLRCGVTAEPESWILRAIAEQFARHASGRLEPVLVSAYEPLPPDLNCVFYSSWMHYYLQPPAARSRPFVALVTHIDRFAFRLAWMARRRRCAVAFMSRPWMRVLRWHGVPPGRLALTPLGIDLDLFPAQPEPPRPPRALIGIAGRLYPDGRKGERLLLEIAGRLRPDQAAFSFIGTRWEEIVATLRGRGFDARYHQDVPGERLPGLFAELDALLICSRREGGPVTAIEALASGTPLISTSVGYVPDLLAACPEGGRLFAGADGAATCIAGARELKIRMRAAYPSIREHLRGYSWPAFSERIARLMLECAGARRSWPEP